MRRPVRSRRAMRRPPYTAKASATPICHQGQFMSDVVPAAEHQAASTPAAAASSADTRATRRSTPLRWRRPLRGARERHDVTKLVPHARLGRPLRPRIPRIQRARRDLQRRAARSAPRASVDEREPEDALPLGEVARLEASAAGAHGHVRASNGRGAMRHAMAASEATTSGSATTATPNVTPARDSARIHSVRANAPTR